MPYIILGDLIFKIKFKLPKTKLNKICVSKQAIKGDPKKIQLAKFTKGTAKKT